VSKLTNISNMTLRDIINPKIFYGILTKVFRNFANWRFYKKQMQHLLADGSLKQNGMRLDRRNRAYYVLNLEPETLMMGEEVLELEKSRVYESLGRKKPMFEKADLGELIEAKTERIKNDNYYAYLIQIKYLPSATFWNVIYVILWVSVLSTIIYFLTKAALNYEVIFAWLSSVMTAK
jgi:hypothetical protein